MCVIENITDQMSKLKITDDLNIDADSVETLINIDFEDSQINDVTIEFGVNKNFECEENEIIEDVFMPPEVNDYINELDLETLLDVLDDIYPLIRDQSSYWAPEIYKVKIKQLTGIDVDHVMHLIHQYNQENHCGTDKESLKRKFVEIVSPNSNKKHCP